MTRLYIVFTRSRNLVTITDAADCIPPDASCVSSLDTLTPELTAMQAAFTALACGREYEVQL